MMTLLQNLRAQDIYKAVTSPISFRFTASTPVNLSMSYSANPVGRCYIEMPSLYYFYKTNETYEEISRPHSMESIDKFQVRYHTSFLLCCHLSFYIFTQGRLHWGQYITPVFTTLQYQPYDPDFYASIVSFKDVAKKYDPGHITANRFLNRVIWLQVPN